MTNQDLLKLAKKWQVITPQNQFISLQESLRFFEIGELIAVCETWAVTNYGIECLIYSYPIAKHRINKETKENWVEQIRRKSWANLADFIEAFEIAEKFFNTPTKKDRQILKEINLRIRYKVFKRDNFRCRLCGISADEGTQLEVDHIEARSTGGADDLKNYWTLCFECNRGKSNLAL